jgi:GNAT superfamily N-acetyltransferase
MVIIRHYCDDDAGNAGVLIADTYAKFNLDFVPPDDLPSYLGPFRHAGSRQETHAQAIAQALKAAMVFVAEDDGQIVGILRGRRDKLQSLFVREDYQRQGVGRRLVEQFEQACDLEEAAEIKVQSSLYAVPFYLAMGYKRTTGIRRMRSFEGAGLQYQPMKKVLRRGSPARACRDACSHQENPA